MTWLHGVFFHSWHWVFQQGQLSNWFGNIVAGVVGYVAGARKLLRDPELHDKIDHIIHHHPDIPDEVVSSRRRRWWSPKPPKVLPRSEK